MDKPLTVPNVQQPAIAVTYEEAPATEAPLVLSVILRAFAEFWGKLEPRSGAFAESAETIAQKLEKGGAIKALVGEETVGVVIYEVRPTDMYFGRLAVVPRWRGQGIAKGLIGAVEARSLALGLARVEIGVRLVLASHQAYYAALGYEPVAYECHPGFSQPTSVTMAKQLR